MRFYKYILTLIAVLALFTGCGKKTDPVVLTEAVPAPGENLRIFNNDEGVVIRNADKRFAVKVQRAVFDPACGCLTDYADITEIPPSTAFVDDNVTADVRYVYSIVALHPVYNNRSQPVKKAVIYAKPVKITDVQIKELAGDRFAFLLKADRPYERFEVFIDGGLELRTSRESFEVNMEGKENRTVTMYPFDKYGNAGEEKIVRLAVKQVVPRAPFGFRNVYGNGTLTLSWGEPEGAWLYNVYIMKGGTYSFLAKVDVPFFMYSVGQNTADCLKFAVSSATDGNESDRTEYEACWP
ncbi:MAG: hypothetical protein LRY50_15765 [Geovibrio sp.]|jgi:hypothetical protein|uniref:hypothetical protein n=1 Tax=Geovibrio ferrireducens TaxID=46201 RepID=UPI0022472E7F|nr:hypothetical protein [Geovibrio ferrireducens]MCD8569705.1 hypothetical protein [Geovibrio sp.]